jgi:large subunit ribosomal protein L18
MIDKTGQRKKRHIRIRKKITGTAEVPRLVVFRSIKHIYASLIDDINNKTLITVSSLSEEFKDKKKGGNIEGAILVGEILSKKAKEKNIEKVVFDRAGYVYHGRIKALADSARKNGLKF